MNQKKFRKRKIHYYQQSSVTSSNKLKKRVRRDRSLEHIDQEFDSENSLSIALIVFVLVLCFIVGITLGYILYRIAMDNSSVLLILNPFIF